MNYNDKIESKKLTITRFIIFKTSIDQLDALSDMWDDFRTNSRANLVIKDTKLKTVKENVLMTVIYYQNEI